MIQNPVFHCKNFNISITRKSKTRKPRKDYSDMFTKSKAPNYVEQLNLLLESSLELTPQKQSRDGKKRTNNVFGELEPKAVAPENEESSPKEDDEKDDEG